MKGWLDAIVLAASVLVALFLFGAALGFIGLGYRAIVGY